MDDKIAKALIKHIENNKDYQNLRIFKKYYELKHSEIQNEKQDEQKEKFLKYYSYNITEINKALELAKTYKKRSEIKLVQAIKELNKKDKNYFKKDKIKEIILLNNLLYCHTFLKEIASAVVNDIKLNKIIKDIKQKKDL